MGPQKVSLSTKHIQNLEVLQVMMMNVNYHLPDKERSMSFIGDF